MIELLIIFIFGLIIGSFLNCVIYRISEDESFIKGSSYCPKCRHPLAFCDLFPVLSFIFLRGKCRYCKAPISWQYPLVELATAILFCLIYYFNPISSFALYSFLQIVFWWITASFFIIIFVFDRKYYIIPDEVIYPAIVLSLIWVFGSFLFGFLDKEHVLENIISTLSISLFFFLLWFFSKGLAMGFGDVKLAIFLGLALGYPKSIVAVFLGFIFGAIIGLLLVAMKKKGLKSEIPFGPFLIVGAIVSMFWGEIIINWYTSFRL